MTGSEAGSALRSRRIGEGKAAGTILHSIPLPHTLGLGSPRNQPQGSKEGKKARLGRAGGVGVMVALQQIPSPSGPQFPNQGTGDVKRKRKTGCPGPSRAPLGL